MPSIYGPSADDKSFQLGASRLGVRSAESMAGTGLFAMPSVIEAEVKRQKGEKAMNQQITTLSR